MKVPRPRTAGVNPDQYRIAVPGDTVTTPVGAGRVVEIEDGPYPSTERYFVSGDGFSGWYGAGDLIAQGKMVSSSARCTNAAFEAITGSCAPEEILDGGHFLEMLGKAGYGYRTDFELADRPKGERRANYYGMTLSKLIPLLPKTGAFYLYTAGHALAYVDGVLTDTEGRGADGRKVIEVFPITKRTGAKLGAKAGDFERGQRVTVKGYPDHPGTIKRITGQGNAYTKVHLWIEFDGDPGKEVPYHYADVIPFVKEARRYSQTPFVCDDCGCPAHSSVSGGLDGHTMLCDDCRAKRGKEPRETAALSDDDLDSMRAGLERRSADYDLTDPDDRALFRGVVGKWLENMHTSFVIQYAIAFGAEVPGNASFTQASRALADAFIRSQGISDGGINTTAASMGAEALADQIMAEAARVEPKVTGDLQRLVGDAGGQMEGLNYRLKGRPRLVEKADQKMRANPNLAWSMVVKDALRYTAIFPEDIYGIQVKAVIDGLTAKGYTPIEVENYWTGKDDYQGINTNFRVPGSELVMELQFHTSNSLRLKEEIVHKFYEQYRTLPDANPMKRMLFDVMRRYWDFVKTPAGAGDIGVPKIHPRPSSPSSSWEMHGIVDSITAPQWLRAAKILCQGMQISVVAQGPEMEVRFSHDGSQGGRGGGRHLHAGGDRRPGGGHGSGHSDRGSLAGDPRPHRRLTAANAFKVTVSKRAQNDYMALDPVVRSDVLRAVRQYQRTGVGDVKRLKDSGKMYRLRVGKVRVLFEKDGVRAIVKRVVFRGSTRWKESARTAARDDLPLAPKGSTVTAADDYPELEDILWERPDHLQSVKVSSLQRTALVESTRAFWLSPDGSIEWVETHGDYGRKAQGFVRGITYLLTNGEGDLYLDYDGKLTEPQVREVVKLYVELGRGTTKVWLGGINETDMFLPQSISDLAARLETKVSRVRIPIPLTVEAAITPKQYRDQQKRKLAPSVGPKGPTMREVVDNDPNPIRRGITRWLTKGLERAGEPNTQDLGLFEQPSFDWCRFRRDSHCWYPKDLDEQGTAEAGYPVWIPHDRGFCWRIKWDGKDGQKGCSLAEPGPESNERVRYPDATIPWDMGGQRKSSLETVAGMDDEAAMARMLVATFGPDCLKSDYSGSPKFVYRSMSESEWQGAQRNGYIQSDQRADREATADSDDFPDFGTVASSEVAIGYLPWSGPGRVVQIKVRPQEGWSFLSDQEAPEYASKARIPISLCKPSPVINSQRPPREFYSGDTPKLPRENESYYGWGVRASKTAAWTASRGFKDHTVSTPAGVYHYWPSENTDHGWEVWTPDGGYLGFATDHAEAKAMIRRDAEIRSEGRKTAAWRDVQSKAKRIRSDGHVRVISVVGSTVTAEVKGDTDLYLTTITRVPGSNQVALWSCGCAWSTYSWARSGRWKKYEGRMCSHALAVTYEAQAQGMFGGEISEQPATPIWRTKEPTGESRTGPPSQWRVDTPRAAHLAAPLAEHLEGLDTAAWIQTEALRVEGDGRDDAVQRRRADRVRHLSGLTQSMARVRADLAAIEAGVDALPSALGVVDDGDRADGIQVTARDFWAQVNGRVYRVLLMHKGDRTVEVEELGTVPMSALVHPAWDPSLGLNPAYGFKVPMPRTAAEGYNDEKYVRVKGDGVNTCKFCGSDDLWGNFFDRDGLGTDDDTQGRWDLLCGQCGKFQIRRNKRLSSLAGLTFVAQDDPVELPQSGFDFAGLGKLHRIAAKSPQFYVITQHGGGEVRRTPFDDFDAALEYAKADTPDTDESLVPNVDESLLPRGYEYEKGLFWFGNKYAVIVQKRPQRLSSLAGLTFVAQDDPVELPQSGFDFAGLVIKAMDSGRVLMTQRTPYYDDHEGAYGKWEFPGGHVDEGETPLEGAMREFTEETGLTLPAEWELRGFYESGKYLAIIIAVSSEAWSVNANLLDHEVMGIGWFEIDHIDGGEWVRAEVQKADLAMVREASGDGWSYSVVRSRDWVGNEATWVWDVSIRYRDRYVEGFGGFATKAEAVAAAQEALARHRGEHVGMVREAALTQVTKDMLDRSPLHFIEVQKPSSISGWKLHIYCTNTDEVMWAMHRLKQSVLDTDWGGDSTIGCKVATARFFEDVDQYPKQRGKGITLYMPRSATLEDDIEWVARNMEGWHHTSEPIHGDDPVLLNGKRVGVWKRYELSEPLDEDLDWGSPEDRRRYHDLYRANAVLHEDPEPALPSTDGDTENPIADVADDYAVTDTEISSVPDHLAPAGDITMMSSMPGIETRAWLMNGTPASDSSDIASAAKAFLEKTALKDFSPVEQRQIIDEGEGTRARNLDRLQLEGTHYQALEEDEVNDDELALW